jgi:hypothetical protein
MSHYTCSGCRHNRIRRNYLDEYGRQCCKFTEGGSHIREKENLSRDIICRFCYNWEKPGEERRWYEQGGEALTET